MLWMMIDCISVEKFRKVSCTQYQSAMVKEILVKVEASKCLNVRTVCVTPNSSPKIKNSTYTTVFSFFEEKKVNSSWLWTCTQEVTWDDDAHTAVYSWILLLERCRNFSHHHHFYFHLHYITKRKENGKHMMVGACSSALFCNHHPPWLINTTNIHSTQEYERSLYFYFWKFA